MTVTRHEARPAAHHRDPNGPSILVPLNGSSRSAAALPFARLAARLIGGTVHVLHVASEQLDTSALLDAMGLQPGSIEGLVVDQSSGPPAEAILRAAASRSTQLIVMTSHGWTGDRRRPLGSVAEAVLIGSSCPLILVRPDLTALTAAAEPALSRILLPLDGTPTTAAALEPAAQLACMSDAVLDILHVVAGPKPVSEQPGALSLPRYVDQPHLDYRAWTHEFQRRFCSKFAGLVQQVSVAVGEPGTEILRVARERSSDLIVLAWKGEFDHTRARTVHQVLRDAPCPVLFLRTTPDALEARATEVAEKS